MQTAGPGPAQPAFPPRLLHAPFLECAATQPDATAVLSENRSLSYSELEIASRKVAITLLGSNCRPGDHIAILLPKSWKQCAAVLGILRANCVFVPLDAKWPSKRVATILDQAHCQTVLLDRGDQEIDVSVDIKLLDIETILSKSSLLDVKLPADMERSPHDLAYVIFTSGSTGTPKGVAITHRAASNTIDGINNSYSVGPRDCVFGLSALSFDLAIYDIFGPMSVGAALSLPSEDARHNPGHWLTRLAKDNVTIWNSVPVLMELLLEASGEPLCGPGFSLRLVLLSGDWVPTDIAPKIRGQNLECRIVSLGGATEASIWSISHEITQKDTHRSSIPYGRGLAGQWVVVCDQNLALCPVQAVGEIVIGGCGIAKGYINDPEKSARQFVRFPVSEEPVYRTGDYGRLMENGEIEFLGRRDNQIKVSGNRIEIGEIEAAALLTDGVDRIHLVPLQDGSTKKLAALYSGTCGEKQLAAALQNIIPTSAVPAFTLRLSSFPTTSNGKIDYAALGALASERQQKFHSLERSENFGLKQKLSSLVSGYLNGTAPSTEQNLIRKGMSSIDIIRFLNAVNLQYDVQIDFDIFHDSPSIDTVFDIITDKQGDESGTSFHFSPVLQTGRYQAWANPVSAAETSCDAGLEAKMHRLHFPGKIKLYKDDINTRRSTRTFALDVIPLEKLARMLSCLRTVERNGDAAYFYPSAGGLYAIDVYVAVKAGRVEGLSAGLYQFSPEKNDLCISTPNIDIDRSVNLGSKNLELADSAAFCIYLVTKPALNVPVYGDEAEKLAYLNAGYMGQLLARSAQQSGLGVCAAHGIDFEAIRMLFNDGPACELLHALYGGCPLGSDNSTSSDRRTRIL